MTASEKLTSRQNMGDDKPVTDNTVTELASKLVDAKLSGSESKAVTTNMFDPNHEFDLAELELDQDIAQLAEQNRSRKSKLLDPTDGDTEEYKKMIEDRIIEGHGEFMMEIGLEDDGSPMDLSDEDMKCALTNLEKILVEVDADYAIMDERNISENPFPEIKTKYVNEEKAPEEAKKSDLPITKVAHIMIRRKNPTIDSILEIRVAVVGNVDAGKSTLLGVLTKGVLDDGRGKARLNLFRHKHEVESGRTSSVGMEILGFNSKSMPITHPSNGGRKLTWEDICSQASKVVSFVDLAGHEKYLKTTVFGMTGCAPDFVMLMVGANAGIIGMTKEHLGLALSLGIPVLVIITKIDMCPPNILESTIKQLVKILKSPGCRKIPMFIKTNEDVVVTAANFVSERLCPIFQISNVTGEGLSLVRNFLNILPSQAKYDSSLPFEYQITDTFSVPFVGTVVSGVVISGVAHIGDNLLLGPDSLGHFIPTAIKGIQRKRVNVPAASAGQGVTLALKRIRRSQLRKGMVMLSHEKDAPMPKACRQFEAEVLVLYHSTTIGQKYQAMVHCGSVRQTARIVNLDQIVLRTGDRATVTFEFIKCPEWLKVGARIIFREGRTKGIGKVTKLLTDPIKTT
ncbi:P-loop containing nucleoside triphosphate hydrolase protein [Umbelopsis sp. AD052]|nr:P-loop containing nucleoside triphosphate hydrolase protein [Umbelopsis sp. AD052]